MTRKYNLDAHSNLKWQDLMRKYFHFVYVLIYCGITISAATACAPAAT